jgi:hypothetical protein
MCHLISSHDSLLHLSPHELVIVILQKMWATWLLDDVGWKGRRGLSLHFPFHFQKKQKKNSLCFSPLVDFLWGGGGGAHLT